MILVDDGSDFGIQIGNNSCYCYGLNVVNYKYSY